MEKCSSCGVTNSLIWMPVKILKSDNFSTNSHNKKESENQNFSLLCNDCFKGKSKEASLSVNSANSCLNKNNINEQKNKKTCLKDSKKVSVSQNSTSKPSEKKTKINIRKSVRLKATSSHSSTRSASLKGKSRRQVLKKNPTKSLSLTSSVSTCQYVFYKDMYWQVGDVVSLVDEDEPYQLYYAEIRGFLNSQDFTKYVYLNWLIPKTTKSEFIKDEGYQDSGPFNREDYTYGPQDNNPYPMNCVHFISHSSPKQNFSFY